MFTQVAPLSAVSLSAAALTAATTAHPAAYTKQGWCIHSGDLVYTLKSCECTPNRQAVYTSRVTGLVCGYTPDQRVYTESLMSNHQAVYTH